MWQDLLHVLFDTQTYLLSFMQTYGLWIYALVFFIIFAETGLVVAAFLPGDSLLFMLGALASQGNLNIYTLWFGLIIAAILGNTCNYFIGRFFGDLMIKKRWVNADNLAKSQAFFDKYGAPTVIFSRFLPLMRTFIPFTCGVSKMNFTRYKFYTIAGAIIWVSTFLWLGYGLGHIPWIKNNLGEIVLLGFLAAVLPLIAMFVWRFWKKIRQKKMSTSPSPIK